jgi:hypothetical protein
LEYLSFVCLLRVEHDFPRTHEEHKVAGLLGQRFPDDFKERPVALDILRYDAYPIEIRVFIVD